MPSGVTGARARPPGPAASRGPRPRGFFITLEGGDGCGKSTHAAQLARWLRTQGYAVRLTREPGGTPLGERLRAALVNQSLSPWAELLLFQAVRAQHVAEVIRPALARGQAVICDRYADSTMAYQGFGRGLDRSAISWLTERVTAGTVPDLTLMLDAPAVAGLRRSRRHQQMERRGLAFQRRVRAGFRTIARRHPARCRIIRVQPTAAATHTAIREVVQRALARRHRA